jgi:alpha-tubulin suppressor-like RCC1 family protein/subtilisin family serine protease
MRIKNITRWFLVLLVLTSIVAVFTHQKKLSANSKVFSTTQNRIAQISKPTLSAPQSVSTFNHPFSKQKISASAQTQAIASQPNQFSTSGNTQQSTYLPIKQKDAFAKGILVAVKNSLPDAEGYFERVKVLKTDFKYPLIRVIEVVRKNPSTGSEEVFARDEMVADHLVVRLTPGLSEKALTQLNQKLGATTLKKMLAPDTFLVTFPGENPDALPEKIVEYNEQVSQVAYAEPDYIVHTVATPTDPSYSQQWNLHNTGQDGGVVDADVDAPEAWNISTGSNAVKVGVIDTGVDYNHTDLAAHCWTNPAEIAGNGIDDDANGFIDDVRGWDFINDDNDPMDDHSHGTHTAGTIGAIGNNGVGVAGVCWNVTLVPIKFLGAGGSGAISDAVDAVYYATQIGVHLTSNSWTGGGYVQALRDAIENANVNGILFVAAAGNDGLDVDINPIYPGSYDNANVISVAATDRTDTLAGFSNYGATTVDLAAPGVEILSTAPNNSYQLLSGTSMAAPHVAGVCALLKSRSMNLSPASLKSIVLETVNSVANLSNKCVTGGRLNANLAIQRIAGSYVTFQSSTLDDDALNGTSGNQNGIVNPGELIGYSVTLKSVGSQTATNVTATLSMAVPNSNVTITQATSSFGNMATGTQKLGTTQFRVQISSSMPTPATIPFVITIQDVLGNTWLHTFNQPVYTSSLVSGRVSRLTGGTPISGATVEYSGTSTGVVPTNADGTYSVSLINGTYDFIAKAPGYTNSAPPRNISVPPAATNINFALGNPEINVTPTSLSLSANEGSAVTAPVTIQNLGDLPLNFSIFGSLYEVTNSDNVGGPTYSWIEISGTGTLINGLGDDSNVGPMPIGFDFPHYGDTFSQFRLCSNGWLTFSDDFSNSAFSNTSLPDASLPGSSVAFFWDDLNFNSGGAAYYQLVDANTLVVEFKNVPFFSDPTKTVTCQVILKRDGTVLLQYQNVGVTSDCTVGIQNDTQTEAVLVAFNQDYLHNNMAVQISKKFGAPWLSTQPISDQIAPGGSRVVQVTCDGSNLIAGTYNTNLGISSNDGDEPIVSIPVTFTVTSAASVPAAPSNLAAAVISGTTINLSWMDNSNNESSFKIERKTGSAGSYSQIATVGSGVTTFSNSGLNPGTEYYYRVLANNSVGNSTYSNTAVAVTTAPPNAPSGLFANAVSGSQINLTWVDNSTNETNFKIERKIGVTGTYTQIALVAANATSYSSKNLSTGTQYFYRVRATNSGGDSAYSNEANATTMSKPLSPSSLAAATVSDTQINLTWTDRSNNETSFRIERKAGAGGTYSQIATLGANTTSFSNVGLTAGVQYFYRVRAYNAAGYSSYSNEASASTTLIPSTPSNLVATTVSSSEIQLTWIDTASNENGFKIERKIGAAGTYALIANTLANVTTFNDTALIAGTEYYYRIAAIGFSGDSTYSNEASTVASDPIIIGAIAGGKYHTVALKDDGTVWTWGSNVYGALGNATTNNSSSPVQAVFLTEIEEVAAGSDHSCALHNNGTVWTWGLNSYGQLGDNTLTKKTSPIQVPGFTGVSQIAAGVSHTVTLKQDGTVWTWGRNTNGQLGDGTTTTRKSPVVVPNLAGVKSVAVRGNHTIALKTDGTVWTWGANASGQLGNGTNTISKIPVPVTGLSNVVAIASGLNHSLALKGDGTVWSWGSNSSGQLGDGTTTTRRTPVLVAGITQCVEINAGDSHSIAIKNNGTAWSWGSNNRGQLGIGSTTSKFSPVQVSNLSSVAGIAGGGYHSIALQHNGTIYTWGYNNKGQLGDGSTTQRTLPTLVPGIDLIAP